MAYGITSDDMLSLRFQIIARLAASDDVTAVVFESMLDSDCKVRIYR